MGRPRNALWVSPSSRLRSLRQKLKNVQLFGQQRICRPISYANTLLRRCLGLPAVGLAGVRLQNVSGHTVLITLTYISFTKQSSFT